MPIDSTQSALAGTLGENSGVRFDFSATAPNQPDWLVRKLVLREEVSGCYALDLEVGARSDVAHAHALLGQSASVSWERDGQTRFVHGIVQRIVPGLATERMTTVHLAIVPALAALEHASSSRIFGKPNQTIPKVVESVLVEALTPFARVVRFDLVKQDYPEREYIVQHRESELSFVQRLLAEQGLWYYFHHPAQAGGCEEMVICDATERSPAAREDPIVDISRDRSTRANHEAVTVLNPVDSMVSTGMLVRQYDWTHPGQLQEKEQLAEEPAGFSLGLYEHGDLAGYAYDEGTRSYGKHETEAQAQMRLDAVRVQRRVFRGHSNVTCLRPGAFVTMEGAEYFILSVAHTGDCTSTSDSATQRGSYDNEFTCVLRAAPYRPVRTAKPRIVGAQTAIVVDRKGGITAPMSSGDGEDIVTDTHGRVRVKFPWDLTEASPTGTNSCWVRVSQAWAGQGWGFQFIPRVGMEVVVQFIDGDPDLPLVTGCLYNGLNRLPYADKPTQSGIKTASSVDPTRYNELRFEDAKDQEQIFVRAQRDYVEEVMRNHTTKVRGNQTQTVSKNQNESIGGSASLAVGGNRSKAINGNESIAVAGERHIKVDKKNTESFQDEHELTVSKAVVEHFHDTHDRTVTGTQTFEAKADKLEHVVGSYELTTDKAFVLNQGGTKLTYEGDKVSLDAAGAINVKRGAATVDIDASGNITVSTTAAISLQVGGNKVVLSAAGIEIEALQLSAKAGPSELALTPASATLTSVNTTVEALAVCSVKGAMMLGLNS